MHERGGKSRHSRHSLRSRHSWRSWFGGPCTDCCSSLFWWLQHTISSRGPADIDVRYCSAMLELSLAPLWSPPFIYMLSGSFGRHQVISITAKVTSPCCT